MATDLKLSTQAAGKGQIRDQVITTLLNEWEVGTQLSQSDLNNLKQSVNTPDERSHICPHNDYRAL